MFLTSFASGVPGDAAAVLYATQRPITFSAAAIVRTRLKSIQYRPALIDAFIIEAGLVIRRQPP